MLAYTTYVPSFSSEWGWNMAFKDENVNPEERFAKLDENLEKMGLTDDKLKYYD